MTNQISGRIALASGPGGGTFAGAKVSLSANTATTGTATVPFDTVVYNDGTAVDTTTPDQPAILRTGKYRISCRVSVHFTAGSPFAATPLRINGTKFDYDLQSYPSTPIELTPWTSYEGTLTVGDVITVALDTGTQAATIYGDATDSTRLNIQYLGA